MATARKPAGRREGPGGAPRPTSASVKAQIRDSKAHVGEQGLGGEGRSGGLLSHGKKLGFYSEWHGASQRV